VNGRAVHMGGLSLVSVAVLAALEGFTTLAVEVIAIRLAIPVVGSSIVLTGITLSTVLLALSAGYWNGGGLSARLAPSDIRARLASNLALAALLYGVAFHLHVPLLAVATNTFGLEVGITLASLLYVAPVFLASQTIPLLTELSASRTLAGEGAGRTLFFSTLGSVAGGALTPIVLFQTLGVSASTLAVIVPLTLCAIVSHTHLRTIGVSLAALVLGVAFVQPVRALAAVDSAYQTLLVVSGEAIRPDENERVDAKARYMVINGAVQSGVGGDGRGAFAYTRDIVRLVHNLRARTVLVVGAAGFTIPIELARLGIRSTAVDIDGAVRPLAERWLWRAPLPAAVRFEVRSARAALREARRYDVVVLDAYVGKSVPSELLTVEAFSDAARMGRVIIANLQLDSTLSSDLARNSLESVRLATGEVHVRQSARSGRFANVLVSNVALPGFTPFEGRGRPYRDDLHTVEFDRLRLLRARP
jgi:hypothetical protein